MTSDFTRPRGWTSRDSGKRASFFRSGHCREFPAAVDGVLRGGIRGSMAVECTCGGDGELQRGTPFCVDSVSRKIVAAIVARRGGTGARLWIDELLSFAGGF